MNKQIEEMAKALTRYEYHLCERLPKDKCLLTSAIHAQVSCDYCKIAEFLVNEGYRKSTDVAREIFEEIEKALSSMKYNANTPRKTVTVDELKEQVDWVLHEVVPNRIAELKKKYESEGANDE